MTRSKKGFTLVELIIVIAVIGVLAAILIPVFSNVIEKANRKSAYSDARNTATQCITSFIDDGIEPVPDILFFIIKGNRIYLNGYSSETGKVVEFGSAFKIENAKDSPEAFDARVDEIIEALQEEDYITPAGREQEVADDYKDRVSEFETDTMRIRADWILDENFANGTLESAGAVNGSDPVGPGNENVPDTDPKPTAAPSPEVPSGTNGNVKFVAGENSANGGGVVSGTMPADQTVAVGGFAHIPDDVIPHSVTLIAGETNAYAFVSWQGSDGKTYYPGDAIKITNSNTLTLTAQWENGYTVLADGDDFTTHLINNREYSGKFILAADTTIALNANMPVGFNYSSYTFTKFTGVLDGAGYAFTPLCAPLYTNFSGIFYENGGIVRNLVVEVHSAYGTEAVGAVAAYNSGEIRNVNVELYVRDTGVALLARSKCWSSSYYMSGYGDIGCSAKTSKAAVVGGIAGRNSGLISGCNIRKTDVQGFNDGNSTPNSGIVITNCGNISGGHTGGIAGENTATGIIEKCSVNGLTIKLVTDSYGEGVGGVVGNNKGIVRECSCTEFNVVNSSYGQDIGGLVGEHESGTIENCYVDFSNNTFKDKFNAKTGANNGNVAGVLVGEINSSAKMNGCVGIGNSDTSNGAYKPFSTYLFSDSSYTESTVTNSYIVGSDPKSVVTSITASDLTSKTVLTGLSEAVWDFSSGRAAIACCM